MTDMPHTLDNPEYAAFVWGRYKRLMAWMTLLSFAMALSVVGWLWWSMGFMPLLMGIFVGLGVFLTVMLATALTALMFLSAGSGHDEQVEDPLSAMIDLDD